MEGARSTSTQQSDLKEKDQGSEITELPSPLLRALCAAWQVPSACAGCSLKPLE